MVKKFILLTSFVLVLGLFADPLNAAGPFLQGDDADGIVSMEAEKFHDNVPQGDHTWEMVTATDGFTGLLGMQALPNSGTNNNPSADYLAKSPRLDYQINFVKTGTYYVWVRAWGASGSDDSVHTGLDGQAIDTCDRMQGFNGNYAWSNDTMDSARSTFEVAAAGDHTFNVWMREDGLIVDKIVLTTNPDYIPQGDGPADSPGGGPGRAQAFGPVPEDGAIEVDITALEWIAGGDAVSHRVYLGTDATIDEADFVGETQLTIQIVTVNPGVTYYWRVDEVQVDGTVIEGEVWSFSTLPLEAHFPSPADGAVNIESGTTLSWTPGKGVIMHDMYFGTDHALVAAADPSTFKGKLFTTSYDPGPLELFTTYYWRVDEFSVTGTNPGPVWSFSTPQYIIVTADETTLNYDNTAEPYVSELSFDTPADLTYGGLADVSLMFKGAAGNLNVDEATGTYDIAGSGADVWGTADQFHYVYRELSGDATIVARVVSNGTGSNLWAKGGVMIRQSIAAGSQHAIMAITGGEGGGGAFQWRPAAGGASSSAHDTAAGMAPGYWVKLDRVGNDISGSYSADGVTWTQQGTAQTIDMADPVLIGLFVTSHAAGEIRWFTFDNVSIVGNAGAEEMSMDVASVSGNAPAPIYMAIEDATGASAAIAHDDPAATMIDQWWKWKIPLSEFSAMGVDVTNAAKLYFGVGDGQPGGAGAVTVDDILVIKPVIISGADVTAAGDNVKGVPDEPRDGSVAGWPSNEHPALAIDDNTGTKYLHFKGEVEPTGFVVEPTAGPTVVTGMTFTTANDAPERDPITFELYGSNESINGAYELIAAGDIVDFADATAWPRFTMNATPITFENATAYKYYKVMFPTVRDPGSANSMQIAEVELIGTNSSPADAGVKINFQQVGGEVPEGYLPDGGEAFGDRGNGYSYGWDMDIQDTARDRGSADAPDERYDTLIHLQKDGRNDIWEIELANGTYDVFLVGGDPSYTDQTNDFDVEGVVVEDPDGEDNFDEYSLTVEVTDGRLTIQPAAGASNCKIMFVDITRI